VYPSSESGPIPVPGTHGNGFANSGDLDRGDDAPFKAQVTFQFTAAGTYHYVCLVHPFMHGTIIVSGSA
jgi:plastocyanin